MIRKIIHIDEEACNGCGLCATACHEGAIDMIDGKAKLMRESFCDGFGDCLPQCPTGAITFEEREAPEYDAAAVEAAKKSEQAIRAAGRGATTMGCPGSRMMQFHRAKSAEDQSAERTERVAFGKPESQLRQWPVQIKLLPEVAPFYDGAKLLIAADCTAYAYANLHEDFMKGKVTLIGCPKLDDIDYSEKLTNIIAQNDIKSVTVVRMEVPCCGALQYAAEQALKNSGKFIPWQVVTISRDGQILD
jgi:ferredoxin